MLLNSENPGGDDIDVVVVVKFAGGGGTTRLLFVTLITLQLEEFEVGVTGGARGMEGGGTCIMEESCCCCCRLTPLELGCWRYAKALGAKALGSAATVLATVCDLLDKTAFLLAGGKPPK